jgi:hypothetical protein
MFDSHIVSTHHSRRRNGIALGVAAGALTAALSQLATAPSARADVYSDILDNVQSVAGVGQSELSLAALDFSQMDFGYGLSLSIAGADNAGLAPQEDLLVETIDALTGNPLRFYDFGYFAPTDLTTAIADAQGVISDGQVYLGSALSDFGSGDFVDGLAQYIAALNDMFVTAPQEVFIGAADTFLGI